MAFTWQMTADAIGDPEPIEVLCECERFQLREKGVGTVEFNIIGLDSEVTFRCAIGEAITLTTKNYTFLNGKPAKVVGYIETVTGSATFDLIAL